MNSAFRGTRITPGPGQESVWDYPRPPRLEPANREIEIVHAGVTVASSRDAKRVLETSHPPVYYIPPDDIRMDLLAANDAASWCEWKGRARYYDLKIEGEIISNVAWGYAKPHTAFEIIRDHLAFYAHLLDACFVDGVQVLPQPGRFYGGWITPDVVGPFKGEAGSAGW